MRRRRCRSPKRIDKYVSKGIGMSTKSSSVCHKDMQICLFLLGNRSGGDCALLGNIGSLSQLYS